MWTWCHLRFSDCNAPYRFAGMHDPPTGTSYQRLSNLQERIMPVGENATKIQSHIQRYDSGKYRWWECGSLGFESSGRREEGRCSSWKLASESFNTLPWITVSHSLTNLNHKCLCVQRSHDLTGSIAFSGGSPNVFLSRFDEISRGDMWHYGRTSELSIFVTWTALLTALTGVTVRGDSRLLKANKSLLYATAFSRWSNLKVDSQDWQSWRRRKFKSRSCVKFKQVLSPAFQK